jgi:hypothetical protein
MGTDHRTHLRGNDSVKATRKEKAGREIGPLFLFYFTAEDAEITESFKRIHREEHEVFKSGWLLEHDVWCLDHP